MASFCYRIRSTQKNKLVKIQILFTVGRGNQFYVDSQYMVLTDAWDNKRQTVKSRFTFTDDFTEQQGRELTKNLSELRSHILGEIAKDPEHAMTKTRLEKIIYSFHHPRSLTTGRRVRSRESLGDYIARFTREMEEGTRLNIHKLRYGPSTIKNYKGFVLQFDEYCKARRKQFDFADTTLVNNRDITEQGFANFIALLADGATPEEVTREGLENWCAGFVGKDHARQVLTKMADDYLFNPNSPFYNEGLYGMYLEALLGKLPQTDAMRSSYRFKLELVKRNN